MRTVAAAVSLMLAGCMIRFEDVQTIPDETNYAAFTCDELAGEKAKIEDGFKAQVHQHRHGTDQAIGRLKGETIAVNASLHVKQCAIAPVVMPMNQPLAKPAA